MAQRSQVCLPLRHCAQAKRGKAHDEECVRRGYRDERNHRRRVGRAHDELLGRRRRGAGWQRGQKWVPRPATMARRIFVPQRKHFLPVRR